MKNSKLHDAGCSGCDSAAGNGLYINYNNATVYRNVITDNYYGIYLDNANNANISENNISFNTIEGIYFATRSNNNYIYYNNITNNGDEGIELNSGENNTIKGNLISNNLGGGSGSAGIVVSDANNTIFENVIVNNGNGANEYGVYLTSNAYDTNISENNISSNNDDNLNIESIDNYIYANNITLAGEEGIEIAAGSTGNNLTDNLIRNSTSFGAFVQDNNNIFANNFIRGSSKFGVYAQSADNLNFTLNSFENNTEYDIYLNYSEYFVMGQNGTNLALNSSFNDSKITLLDKGNLTVQYYARANVTSSLGAALTGAFVISNDSFRTTEWNDNTAASGYTGYFAVTDYVKNASHPVYYNNHTATANLSNYGNNSAMYNVSVKTTNSTTVTVVLTAAYCNGNYASGNWVISSNIQCANQSIPVTGNITIAAGGTLTLYNVTINFTTSADGSNFINKTAGGGLFIYDVDSNASTTNDQSWIRANNTDFEYDFWVWGTPDTNIANFTMQNSKVTDAGYISGASCDSESCGVQLYNVSNVIIKNNNISYGARYGLYLQYSTNNFMVNNTINTTGNTGFAIYLLSSSSSNNISGNTIMTSGDDGYGISLQSNSNSNIISSNTITTTGGALVTASYGIYLSSSSNSNITSNTITTNGSSGIGIYLLSSSNSNTLQSNTITTNGSSGYGIYLSSSSSNNATSNIINATGTNADGVYVFSNSDNNILNLNNITRAGRDGVRIEKSGVSIPGNNTITANRSEER